MVFEARWGRSPSAIEVPDLSSLCEGIAPRVFVLVIILRIVPIWRHFSTGTLSWENGLATSNGIPNKDIHVPQKERGE